MSSRELDRLAAGCLLPSFSGASVPQWLRGWLDRGLGGVVLFAGNVESGEQLAVLSAELGDVVVALDEEGGDVTRLEAATGSSYPGNLALGVVDDVAVTRSVAAAMAGELARAGVTLNLAPVADVNTNPANPVIGVRSFGPDPGLVARHVAAFVGGTQSVGVAACAKHFPGHGDTHVDSHLALPVVDADLGGALRPFRAAVDAGVRAVMVGHLLVPALDDRPATTSRSIVTDLLRGELGFDGLVVTDALDMGAIAGTVGVEEAAVRALEAGVDALCLGPAIGSGGVDSVHRAVVDAVAGGRLPAGRLDEAGERARGAAVRAPGPDAVDRRVGAAAAARAVRATGDVYAGEAPLVVELIPRPNIAAGEPGFDFVAAVTAVLPRVSAVRLGTGSPAPELHGPGRLVLALRGAAADPWQQHVAGALLAKRPDAVVVELGLPGWIPPGAAAAIRTHGAGRASLVAAADLLADPPT